MTQPLRKKLASIREADRVTRWGNVGEVGRVRPRTTRQGKIHFEVDLRPYGRIYSAPGVGPLETRRDADRVLNHIQGELAKGKALEEILLAYLPKHAKPNLIKTKLSVWLQDKRDLMKVGDRSPTYLRELERYARSDGHLSWWYGRSIFEIDTAAVDDWERWLRKRGIAAKTRRNVVGAFRSFLGWLKRRGQLKILPEMPEIPIDEHSPTIITVETQDMILAAIPDDRRGVFFALARLGLRAGEARALEVRDYRDGWLTVEKAAKGLTHAAPIRGTKTRQIRRVPMDPDLGEWLDRYLAARDRLRGTARMFRNPKTGEPWTYWALRATWERACKEVGVKVCLYEGTKHAMATDAINRGVQERHLQAFLGHADARSTRRYAKLADQGLLTVLRRRSDKRATSPSKGEDE